MVYLDEQIEVKVTNLSVPEMGNYEYRVILENEVIFIGQTFITQGETEKVFNISDIVSNYAYINKSIFNNDTNKDNIVLTFSVVLKIANAEFQSDSVDVYLVYRYPHQLKRLNRDSKALLQGGLIPVYPNVDTDEYGVNYSIYTDADTDKAITIQYKHNDKQGISLAQENYTNDETIAQTVSLSDINDYGTITDPFIPTEYTLSTTSSNVLLYDNNRFIAYQLGGTLRITYNFGTLAVKLGEYTWKSDDERKVLHFSWSASPDTNIAALRFEIVNNGTLTGIIAFDSNLANKLRGIPFKINFDFELNDAPNDDIEVSNIKVLVPLSISPSITEGIHLMTIDSNADVTDDIKIGEFCDNLDGYYLQWQDRMGGLQSQHFSGTHKFTNTYDNQQIVNYTGHKRNVAKSITSKWEINSDWITEDKYPYYESILVSPYLKLYDVKEDKSYFVVITDTLFEEKTFYNQNRSLFNLKLNLENDIKQNIVY